MSQKLRILLTNDDGYDAEGLIALEQVLATHGEVWVIAPDRERSATSNHISIRETLDLKEVGERRYSLSGYPADCANVGFYSGVFPEFDLVVSGINHGPNLGDDVHYSGTVAAARHGAVHHVRGIAISYAAYGVEANMDRAAKWLEAWLFDHYEDVAPGIVYNINYPHEGGDASADAPFPEVRYTYQGKRTYRDEYQVEPGSAGEWQVRLKETEFFHVEDDHSDSEAVVAGHISISPLSIFTTDRRELRKWFHRARRKKS